MTISEQQRQKNIQSWHEPALNTLSRLLDKRKAKLRENKRDEKQAAVTRDEYMQALVNEHGCHGIYLHQAGTIISSLYRAKRIRYLGSTFIQILDEGESQ